MATIDKLLRVSKAGTRNMDADTTMTVRDQESALDDAIRARGDSPGKTFKAIDQSGFTLYGSKVYGQLMERISSGQSAGFGVAYSSRGGRNWWGSGRMFSELAELGATFIDATKPHIDYRTNEGRLLMGLEAVVNEMPALEARTKSNRILAEQVAKGVANVVPYGYRRNGFVDAAGRTVKEDEALHTKALVLDPVTSKVVRWIFDLRLEGISWAEMGRTLNAEQISAPAGGLWTTPSLATVIRNEVYTGVLKQGKHRNEKGAPALVTRSEWERANVMRTLTRNGRQKGGLAYGAVVCSGCGHPMKARAGTRNTMNYGCGRLRSTGICPRPVTITMSHVDQWVEDRILELLEGGEFHAVASAREIEERRADLSEAREEVLRWVDKESTVKPEHWQRGYEARAERELEAERAYNEAVERAGEVEELPTSREAWQALGEREGIDGQRKVVRSLLRVKVLPPGPRREWKTTPVTDRLEPLWRDGR